MKIVTAIFLIMIAVGLLAVLTIPCLIYSILSMIWNRCDKLTVYIYFRRIALGIDELGNTVCSRLFNDILIYKKIGYHFGLDGETISSVLGKNVEINNLKPLGKALNWLLNKIQKNHSIISINNNVNNLN